MRSSERSALLGMAVLVACGEPRRRADEPTSSGAPETTPAAPQPVAAQRLAATNVDDATKRRVLDAARGAHAACAPDAPTREVTGYGDAQGRRWYTAQCRSGARVALVVVAGDLAKAPSVGVSYAADYGDLGVDGVEIYELPAGPLLCIDHSWHDESTLSEGWMTACLRELDGALAAVFTTDDTSRADGTTTSYEVFAGPPEEIWAIQDCDDCEVCAFEDDCTQVPPGVQRYVTHRVWDGRAFVAQGEQVRMGPAPLPRR